MLPTKITVPPLRILSMEAFMLSVWPTASIATSAPAPPVSFPTCAGTSDFADKATCAPTSSASLRRELSRSDTRMREQSAARSACTIKRPIIPAPTTKAVLLPETSAKETAWTATDTASSMAASSKERLSGRRYTMREGTATNSAKAPARR